MSKKKIKKEFIVEALENMVHRTTYLVEASNEKEAEMMCIGRKVFVRSSVVDTLGDWLKTVKVSKIKKT